MPVQLQNVVKAFRQSVQFASPLSANILNCDDKENLSVATIWSQNNLERKVKMNSEMFHSVNVESKKVSTFGCSDCSNQIISSYSPSSLLRALVREVPASDNTPKKQYIEIWKENLMVKQFDLHSLDQHGDIYADSDFSSFEWSPNEEHILYVAEKKQPKSESFLSSKVKSEIKENIAKGNEYLYLEDWGEQQVGKCKSVLAIADLIKDNVKILEVKTENDYFYASATWAPDGGIIAVAYVIEPRRLGRVYCTNRASFMVHISPEGHFTKLSDDGKSVFGPRLSPDGSKLVWFQRDVGGPHHSCVSLIKFDWRLKTHSIVIDVVSTEIKCTGGQSFYGLYNFMRPSNCWLSDSRFVILSTAQRASVKTYAIDTTNGNISEISGATDEEYSQGVLQVWRNYVVCWRSSLNNVPGVYLAKINTYLFDNVNWLPIVQCKKINEKFNVNILRLTPDFNGEASNFSAIYYGPDSGNKVPLVVWSHGGPQSSFNNVFDLAASFFANVGFAVLMVNYRGSIGAGTKSLNYLLGKIGKSDVADIKSACDYVFKNFPSIDSNKCVLFGGSHGGFLTLHLAGQHPDSFKCAVVRNPVTDLTQMSASDIPDWVFVESGFKYAPLNRLSGKDLDKLWEASPISYIDKVKVPVLLLIGSKDLRVPQSQGINYYYALKESRKEKVKLLLYEDNHPLGLSESDCLINSVKWFMEALEL